MTNNPRKDQDILSMGYDRFLDFLPADTWKLLPHTFALHVSHGLWKPYKYLVMLSHIIATMIGRGNGRLIVSLPPRHGKSFFISQYLPAWFLCNWPDKKVILTSYEANFAASWGRKVRNLIKEEGGKLGVYLADDATASNNWMTIQEGGMMTAGVGGPITGKGGDLLLCFPGETLIETELGQVKISELCSLENPPLVLTYDHISGNLVFRKITGKKVSYATEFIELKTTGGYTIRSTREHRIYDCERGYRQADNLLPGDRVLIFEKVKKSQNLCNMRETTIAGGEKYDSQGMLQQGTENYSDIKVRSLWQRISTNSLCIRKAIKKRTYRFLLFFGMQSKASFIQKHSLSTMSCMWWTNKIKRSQILFKGMSSQRCTTSSLARQDMCVLWNYVPSKFKSFSVLFKEMSECCTFGTNERFRKFSLQRWNQLCKVFQGNASVYFKTRSQQMLCLWQRKLHEIKWKGWRKDRYYNSPYQSGSNRQQTREFNKSLFYMPFSSSSLKCDTISRARRICNNSESVYDIEVEGTHNFFANGILVHNCDDPHKNWQEAKSPANKAEMKSWWDSTFYTRAEPGASIIVLATRWDQDDLIGYVLREKQSDGWTYLRIPAIAEDEDDVLGRKPGEALCPERYDEKALLKIKNNVSPMVWAALFQQRPAPMEGTVFLREHWKYYTISPHCHFILQSWDTASKKNLDAAYSVCQTWGVSEMGAILLDQWRARVEFPQLLQQAKIQYVKHQPNVVLIEDRDSGQALIQSLQQNSIMPIIPVIPDMDKVIRAHAVSPMQASGRVWVPDPTLPDNRWVADFIENQAMFPNGQFKDDTDAMSQALAYIMTMAMGGRVMSFERRKTSKLLEGYRSMM